MTRKGVLRCMKHAPHIGLLDDDTGQRDNQSHAVQHQYLLTVCPARCTTPPMLFLEIEPTEGELRTSKQGHVIVDTQQKAWTWPKPREIKHVAVHMKVFNPISSKSPDWMIRSGPDKLVALLHDKLGKLIQWRGSHVQGYKCGPIASVVAHNKLMVMPDYELF